MEEHLKRTLQEFLARNDATSQAESVRLLRARLADFPTLETGRAAILVAAAAEGVPESLEHASQKDAARIMASTAHQLARCRHILLPDAEWAVKTWAASFGLIDMSEVTRPSSQTTPTFPTSAHSSLSKGAAQPLVVPKSVSRSYIAAWLKNGRNQLGTWGQRGAQLCRPALKVGAAAGIGAALVVAIATVVVDKNKWISPSRKATVPNAQSQPTEPLPTTAAVEPYTPTDEPRAPHQDATNEVTPPSPPAGSAAQELVSTSTVTPRTSAHELVWGDRGSFPHLLAVCFTRMALSQQEESENELRRNAELAEISAELTALLTSQQGRHAKARMSVSNVVGDEVLLVADISWGWPTEDPHTFSPNGNFERWAPREGLVYLALNSRNPRELLSFKLRSDLVHNIAECLRWNDKVVVDFDVQRVVDRGSDAKPRFFVFADNVRLENVAWAANRPSVWPSEGTFPHTVSAFASWNYKERRMLIGTPDFESFLTFANRTLKTGQAYLRVVRVTDSVVELSNDVTSPNQGRPGMVYLRPADSSTSEITIPVSSIGNERASQLTGHSKLLVAFNVVGVQEGTVYVPQRGLGMRGTAGVQVSIHGIRLAEGG